jgi:4-hydroxy-3-polyprenylbenzoate decarboxylase
MSFNDLREYITSLEKEGELQRISRTVDWNLEVGAIIRRAMDLKAPAPLFEQINGYPAGYRILGAPVAPSRRPSRYFTRMALALGMNVKSTAQDIIEEYIRRKNRPKISPRQVSTAPCKEVICKGEEVDLFRLPVPLLHAGDGGRYLCTWSAMITRDPESEWVNWGNYRGMIHDRKTLGCNVSPRQHIGMHYQKYEAQGRPMEFAIALGTEPLIGIIAGANTAPDGEEEADLIGAIQGKPVNVIRAETLDLMVPASSEIVIEGVVNPHERRVEGPFGEYSGYQTVSAPQPVFHVQCITHRSDPILPVVCAGVPVEDHVCLALTLAADILDELRGKGLPVSTAFIPPNSALHRLVVAVKESRSDLARDVAEIAWSTKLGPALPQVVVVNDDVDITNPAELEWAMATRLHPQRGIIPYSGKIFFPFWAFLSPEERAEQKGSSVVFDCTWPAKQKEGRRQKASFDTLWPDEIQQRVLRNWSQYGYPEE